MKRLFIISSLVFFSSVASYLFSSCQKSANANGKNDISQASGIAAVDPYKPTTEWNNYWYQGKAELTSYFLKQSRYGEIHEGTVVNIFVTEDFSKTKQVKLDNPSGAGNDKLSVLKLNQSFKFNTGIYPYSMMMSSFQAVDIYNYPHAVKVTSSVQEWCGMAYYQMNDKGNQFEIELRSYFEQEGDKDLKVDAVIQEDELWNLIRIDPSKLPTGSHNVLPGAIYLRLAHKPIEPVKATISLVTEDNISKYIIDMPALKRKLVISFEQQFPFRILTWEDSYPGFDGRILTTTAVRNKEIILDYWRTHTNNDRVLREQLGIPMDTQ